MMSNESEQMLLNLMLSSKPIVQELNWESLYTVPILQLVTMRDIVDLKSLILSPRYSGNSRLKLKKMDELMHSRGFIKFAGGTNRVVYKHPFAANAVFKVAIDAVGINDNPAEFRNQQLLKPYCCKVFECSPCGTIASFELVDRITTIEEFYSIAEDYFYLLSRKIMGKYVMEDIGIDYFMNVGIRKGFGPVLLDFPYLFELDGAKLICSATPNDGPVCGGEVDYDAGFNKLICKRCGKHYNARDLAKTPNHRSPIVYKKGREKMKIRIMEGDRVVESINTEAEREFLSEKDKKFYPKSAKKKDHKLTVTIVEGGNREPAEPVVEKTKPSSVSVSIKTVTVPGKNKKNNRPDRIVNKPVIKQDKVKDEEKQIQQILDEISLIQEETPEEEINVNRNEISIDEDNENINIEDFLMPMTDDSIEGYLFVDELPPVKEAMTDLVYCVKISNTVDLSIYEDSDIMDPKLIDQSLFGIYRRDLDAGYIRYQINEDGELEPYYSSNEDLLNDKIIKKAMKKDTKKPSTRKKK